MVGSSDPSVHKAKTITIHLDHTNPPHPRHPLFNILHFIILFKCSNLIRTHKSELPHCNLILLHLFKSDVWGWGGFVWSPIQIHLMDLAKGTYSSARVLVGAGLVLSEGTALCTRVAAHSSSSSKLLRVLRPTILPQLWPTVAYEESSLMRRARLHQPSHGEGRSTRRPRWTRRARAFRYGLTRIYPCAMTARPRAAS
jgi:hypothetical protein